MHIAHKRNAKWVQSRHVKMDGITFDSVKESQTYQLLKLLEGKQKISELEVHVAHKLSQSTKVYSPAGTRTKEISFKVDFLYLVAGDEKKTAHEVKGRWTQHGLTKFCWFYDLYNDKYNIVVS